MTATHKPFFVRTKIVTGIAIFLSLGAIAYMLVKPKSYNVETYKVTTSTFIQIIKEDGMTRSKDRFLVTSPYTGQMDRITLKVGDRVRKGQKVAHVSWDRESDIYAPADGVISKIIRDSAGAINRGESLLEISNPKNLEVAVDLLTKDATQVKEGFDVEIKNWGGPDSLVGKVKRVEPTAFTKVSSLGVEEQRVNVLIDITTPKEKWESLGDYFRVECQIQIYKADNQLLVPLSALFRLKDDWAVFTVEGMKAKLKTIQISRKNQTDAIVEAGLNKGEVVILYPGDSIHDGTLVQVSK